MITKLFVVGFIFLIPLYASAFADTTKIDLSYPNGDRVLLSSAIKMVIVSDESKQELTGNISKPYFEAALVPHQRYQIQTFIEGILVDTTYVVPDSNTLHLVVPSPTGMRLTVLYNDGETPIIGAKVSIIPNSGKTIREGITDLSGNTVRYWLPPTTHDSYKIRVSFGDITFDSDPIDSKSGSNNFTIKTQWPAQVDYLKVYAYQSKTTKYDWSQSVNANLYKNKNLIQTTPFHKGEAFFTNLVVGTYRLQIESAKSLMYNQTITVVEKTNEAKLIIQSDVQTDKPHDKTKPHNGIIDTKWKLVSAKGKQIDALAGLATDGSKEPVFIRSYTLNPTVDLTRQQIQFLIKIDKPAKITQFWLSLSSDDFKTNWLTFRPIISDIKPDTWDKITINVQNSTTTRGPDISKINRIQVRVTDNGEPVTLFVGNINTKMLQGDSMQTTYVPAWVKDHARLWVEGKITDKDFVHEIGFLIKSGVLHIPSSHSSEHTSKIPSWLKDNLRQLTDVDDAEFVSTIQYMVSNGMIPI